MTRWTLMCAAVLLAACSGGEQSADRQQGGADAASPSDDKSGRATTAGAKACEVIDKASVDSAMGRDMGQPTSSTDTMCQYLWSGERPSDQAMTSLIIHDVPLTSLEPGLNDMKAEIAPVAGLGERAFWAKGYGLYVQNHGRSGIFIAAHGLGEDEEAQNMAKTEALARATVSKL